MHQIYTESNIKLNLNCRWFLLNIRIYFSRRAVAMCSNMKKAKNKKIHTKTV